MASRAVPRRRERERKKREIERYAIISKYFISTCDTTQTRLRPRQRHGRKIDERRTIVSRRRRDRAVSPNKSRRSRESERNGRISDRSFIRRRSLFEEWLRSHKYVTSPSFVDLQSLSRSTSVFIISEIIFDSRIDSEFMNNLLFQSVLYIWRLESYRTTLVEITKDVS